MKTVSMKHKVLGNLFELDGLVYIFPILYLIFGSLLFLLLNRENITNCEIILVVWIQKERG